MRVSYIDAVSESADNCVLKKTIKERLKWIQNAQ